MVIVLLAAAAVLAAFSIGRSSGAAAPWLVAPTAPRHVVVQPGQTLWTIARGLAPRRDTRDTVEQLRRLNRLPTEGLVSGQDLALPGG